MKLEEMNLSKLISKAEENGACQEELDKLLSFNSIEEALKSNKAPYWCYWYAAEVIQGRWIEGEPVILTSARYSYWYALDVIKGRWLEAEPIILTDANFSYWYALDVIKGRWLARSGVYYFNFR